MTVLKAEVEPREVGLDPERLARIDRRFARHVDEGGLPGWLLLIARRGRIAHLASYGHRDIETAQPVAQDTLFRLFSMTKPITSVAAMMLYEEGEFDLTSPIARWLPEFAHPRVYVKGSPQTLVTAPATEPIRVWHLLSHTAGLTYGFHNQHPVDALYRAAGFGGTGHAELDLAQSSEKYGQLPLLFEPGTSWGYSVATDILGRLVEVVSGQSLDAFFAERILTPLGMHDTTFGVDGAADERLATLYVADPVAGRPVRAGEDLAGLGRGRPHFLSGGAGLVSSAADYHRFAQFLLRGGELDGVRLLSPRTVRLMAANHLPGGADIAAFGSGLANSFDGYGFGLGFSVLQDPVTAETLSSRGEFGWAGGAGTDFWVDPAEELTALFLTHQVPGGALGRELRQLVYQSLTS